MRATKRRALGQHFLRDAGVARAIVDLVAPTAADLVVEIGPGEGALTGELVRRAGRVVALEIDRGLAGRLSARFPSIEVVEADARVWEYGAIARPRDGRALVVGNLPYSVGKPILAALIAARTAIDEMVLMLQREVAERVAAPPGGKTYGSLSVLSQLYCDARIALRVPPGAFRPPPGGPPPARASGPARRAVGRAPLPRGRARGVRAAAQDARERAGRRPRRVTCGGASVGHNRWCGSRPAGRNPLNS